MDARELVGPGFDRIDALAEHAEPFEFAGDDAHAIGLLGMVHPGEVFGQAIVVRNEHVTASWALGSSWASAVRRL